MEKKELILDFTNLNEGLAEEGAKLKGALMALLGLDDYFRLFPIPSAVRGTASQLSSLQNAATSEKQYIKALEKHGLNNPATFASRSRLESAIKNFERETGMKWPLK